MIRIGHGYDVHAFGEGDHIILGGVRIAHDRGLVAHSDGDVLIHALCDALLGAVGWGDIGRHFPDTDSRFRNIDSRKLLREVVAGLQHAGWCLGNADLTIVAQAPRLASLLPAMLSNLASDLDSSVERLNIKATTTEKLGFTGRGEGIACYAVVLVNQQ